MVNKNLKNYLTDKDNKFSNIDFSTNLPLPIQTNEKITVTVLGANGTMGRNVAAIFASFGQCIVYMVCRSQEKANTAKEQAIQSVKAESIKNNLITGTYDQIESYIRHSNIVFESVSEDFKVKQDIYNMIRPYLKKDAIIATGTSGLSIRKLSDELGQYKNRFFGIHMFNPPYNLTLCELVVHSEEQKELAVQLKRYLKDKLNRTVVEVKDEPSFLGNRIGFFFIGEAMRLADKYQDQGGIDYIDSVLGCFTGRNMSPLVTADFVGLDVTKSIIDYIYDNVHDEYRNSFLSPEYLDHLVAENKLGHKVNRGFYYKDRDRKLMFVYDIKQKNYRLVNKYQFYFSNEMIKLLRNGQYEKAIELLINDESQEAILCKQMLLIYIVYSLKISSEVSSDIASCDDAMATGFSWIPPIALIELFGGKRTTRNLVNRYLDEKYQSIVNNEEFYDNVPEHSKYDFRSFLKAKY
ncbi:3-hydroxyacyl-CoA dehydrogenase family protein [Traorella massiliensis]|uniref:3-hydroxyacyl-CoA dehydrogenase family protein n=1 Tax=Traorella massiliensis TaxID=1903263 RepID=UPI0023544662|nr:3-hydroxyacyl-CoA dehydrogenase family protein [Traorella massiliensis]